MDKKREATKLRLEGKSYGEIMKLLDISSKGTLSYWFRDLKLSPAAQRRLRHNTELAYKRGLAAFNQRRTKNIHKENTYLLKSSKGEIASLSRGSIRLIGAALYWAEGTKRFDSRKAPYIAFANSDPKMVRVFMRYLREVLRIEDRRIRAGIIAHPRIDTERAMTFWAEVTNLSKDIFWVSTNVSRASKKRRPTNRLPHGTLHLRVNSRQYFYQVAGHIEGISKWCL